MKKWFLNDPDEILESLKKRLEVFEKQFLAFGLSTRGKLLLTVPLTVLGIIFVIGMLSGNKDNLIIQFVLCVAMVFVTLRTYFFTLAFPDSRWHLWYFRFMSIITIVQGLAFTILLGAR